MDLARVISFLLDKSADESGRDDVAMDLSDSNDYRAFAALLQVAKDENDSELIRDSCMESIAQILYRNKENKKYLDGIGVKQLMEALKIIKLIRPNLFNDFELTSLE